jgi:hypothetical protein
MKAFWIITCSLVAIFTLCVCCLCLVGFGGLAAYTLADTSATPVVLRPATLAATPLVIRPTLPPTPRPLASATPQQSDQPTAEGKLIPTIAAVTPPPTVENQLQGVQSPTPATYGWAGVSDETIRTLNEVIVPTNDLLELAERLGGKGQLSPTVEPAPAFDVGDGRDFWVTNVDSNNTFRITAILRYETDHTYFWIEDDVEYNEDDLRDLAETFENETYPTNRQFFGSEWTPGVDGDPHLYIIYAGGLGYSLAGYFSAADSYPPEAHEYSNAHETFMINADNMDLGDPDTASTLAHEFQHMIHWYGDRNETSWMNEGFSVLAEFLLDYPVYFDYNYITDPDRQLTNWPTDSSDTLPNYGAGFLFTNYFLNRFGKAATQQLVAEPANGMESVDVVLDEIGAVDNLTGQPISADDVFLDWTIANYLQNNSVADGRYAYANYPDAYKADATETISTCPSNQRVRDVHQFGVDYIHIDCTGEYTLHFEGSVQTNLLPEGAHSGDYAFWSNKGDESDMTLTQQFDFSAVSGPLTLSYWMWHDLEEDYDYAYLLASTDGQTWQILETPTCTTLDPSGNSYGCGYNGMSGGGSQARWVQEQVDISQFAGQQVWLRFEYITDAAVNGEGLLLDDIAIAEIGYASDFEANSGGWQAAGFARVTNILPQTFRLALIEHGSQTTVTYLTLDETLAADIPLALGGSVQSVTLVVSGTTPYTRQKAAYQYEIQP